MSATSAIEWTSATWNPVAGCSVVSPGCKHCYAMKMAARIEAMQAALGKPTHYAGLTRPGKAGAVWTGKMAVAPDETMTQPLRWKKPRRIFVNSMSDLFHEDVADETIDLVFAVMALSPWHTYQILTKRAKRMREYASNPSTAFRIDKASDEISGRHGNDAPFWPLPNVWLGVSTEDQERADERIPELLATPAAVRFLSCEPLLGPVDLMEVIPNPLIWSPVHGMTRLVDLVIIGGESGPRSRPFMLSWAASLIDQCRSAGVAAFMKQVGAEAYDDRSYVGSTPRFQTKDKKGGDMSEWPEDLRVRELPT